MSSSGGNINAKVSRLLSRSRGRPVLKPNKPLVLANRVANRRLGLGEATCITEMSVMMACWKENNFSEVVCAKEIQNFYGCAAKAEAQRKAKAREDNLEQAGTLSPKQATILLQRYPNITKET
ncbi:coiled-coil-helix-coiled-coil-helix domain-containing protein 1 [Callorhinchus milii]|uniref:Coiled-coil-helix-coiled-coil-helix domain containing 1 n=1 Tax=Callorhinchus milii TaxID=7868 RepID=K4FT62_CALMI|nr:coiled-coil-helix-coiled-coil-helix domain-containing protein 1 [Callorhinchus milii]AFK10925.1 Coiled-coil-helix-coiled-coil-helix domain-containing protein 1 [Callorhinchus milii]|eukprot:gi/632936832/ref/XP_007896271.1/ PREDICTED: coiled-coil-helix-coiled-coil-helix domain-containing protein 1 [Callorhinchus milii]